MEAEFLGSELCFDCGTELVRRCPCCQPTADALGNGADPATTIRTKRISSQPPPVPAEARTKKPRGFAKKLLEINRKRLGPSHALDLTDIVVEDTEDLAQDQIDALFGN